MAAKKSKKTAKKTGSKAPAKAVAQQLKKIRKATTTAKKARESIEKAAKKSVKTQKKIGSVLKRTVDQSKKVNSELSKLKTAMADMRKRKTPRKQLNEYNLFMRRQLNEGKTFNQSVQLWNRLRKVEEGKLPVKTKTKIKTVIKKVRVKSKAPAPKTIVKYKTRTKVVRKPAVKEAVLSTAMSDLAEKVAWETAQKMQSQHPEVPLSRLEALAQKVARETVQQLPSKEDPSPAVLQALAEKVAFETVKQLPVKDSSPSSVALQDLAEKVVRETLDQLPAKESAPSQAVLDQLAERVALQVNDKVKKNLWAEKVSSSKTVHSEQTSSGTEAGLSIMQDLPSEEMAYRMVKVYFEELARTGFKRQMSLDDLVDAFLYSWYRVEKQLGLKEKRIHNEEMAYRLVNLYFIELARLGHKRTLSLDELLNAYFYVLDRLGKDNTELIKKMESIKNTQFSTETKTVSSTMVTEIKQ